jgi:hypothetical protein
MKPLSRAAYGTILICLVVALVGSILLAQTRIGETQMPSGAGTGIRAIVAGVSRLLPLDPSLEVAGTPLVLRVNPSLTAVRSKTVSLAYTGTPLTLPDTPLTTGAVLVFVGGLMQAVTTDYTLSGTTLTPTAAAQPVWTAQGTVLVFYFF